MGFKKLSILLVISVSSSLIFSSYPKEKDQIKHDKKIEVLRKKNSSPEQTLIDGVLFDDYKIVQKALTEGADPDTMICREGSVLALATEKGNIDIVKLLLQAGAKVNEKGFGSWSLTPLHEAAKEGHTKIAKILLKAGADVKSVDHNGYTPLHLAAYAGEKGEEIVEVFLNHSKTNPNAKSYQGETPLHLVTSKKSACALLQKYADPNAKAFPQGTTPLHKAVLRGNAAIVDALMRHKADPHAQSSEFSRKGTPIDLAKTKIKENRDSKPDKFQAEMILRILKKRF